MKEIENDPRYKELLDEEANESHLTTWQDIEYNANLDEFDVNFMQAFYEIQIRALHRYYEEKIQEKDKEISEYHDDNYRIGSELTEANVMIEKLKKYPVEFCKYLLSESIYAIVAYRLNRGEGYSSIIPDMYQVFEQLNQPKQ